MASICSFVYQCVYAHLINTPLPYFGDDLQCSVVDYHVDLGNEKQDVPRDSEEKPRICPLFEYLEQFLKTCFVLYNNLLSSGPYPIIFQENLAPKSGCS